MFSAVNKALGGGNKPSVDDLGTDYVMVNSPCLSSTNKRAESQASKSTEPSSSASSSSEEKDSSPNDKSPSCNTESLVSNTIPTNMESLVANTPSNASIPSNTGTTDPRLWNLPVPRYATAPVTTDDDPGEEAPANEHLWEPVVSFNGITVDNVAVALGPYNTLGKQLGQLSLRPNEWVVIYRLYSNGWARGSKVNIDLWREHEQRADGPRTGVFPVWAVKLL